MTLVVASGANKALAAQLQKRAKAQPNEALVLIGGNAATGLVDLTQRQFSQAKQPLPTERVLVSPTLLRLYGKSAIELAPLPANDTPSQLLRLQ